MKECCVHIQVNPQIHRCDTDRVLIQINPPIYRWDKNVIVTPKTILMVFQNQGGF